MATSGIIQVPGPSTTTRTGRLCPHVAIPGTGVRGKWSYCAKYACSKSSSARPKIIAKMDLDWMLNGFSPSQLLNATPPTRTFLQFQGYCRSIQVYQRRGTTKSDEAIALEQTLRCEPRLRPSNGCFHKKKWGTMSMYRYRMVRVLVQVFVVFYQRSGTWSDLIPAQSLGGWRTSLLALRSLCKESLRGETSASLPPCPALRPFGGKDLIASDEASLHWKHLQDSTLFCWVAGQSEPPQIKRLQHPRGRPGPQFSSCGGNAKTRKHLCKLQAHRNLYIIHRIHDTGFVCQLSLLFDINLSSHWASSACVRAFTCTGVACGKNSATEQLECPRMGLTNTSSKYQISIFPAYIYCLIMLPAIWHKGGHM